MFVFMEIKHVDNWDRRSVAVLTDSQPPQKRANTVETMAVTQRASAADLTWTKDFPWLLIKPDAVYCSWCIKYNQTFVTNGGVWTKKACKRIRRGRLALTRMQLPCRQRSVLRKQVLQHRSSLESYLEVVHFLTIHEMAHTTKFKPLLELVRDLGAPELETFQRSNANYTSYRSLNEMVLSLSDVLEADILQVAARSPYLALITDESADIATMEELVVCIRSLEPATADLNTRFLANINPSSPHDALKHHFTSLKTELISLQPRV